MYPYLNLGPAHLGMFGLMLWLAAVAATVILHRNFQRNGVDADALNIVATVVVAGIVGAKLWHEFEDPHIFRHSLHIIFSPGFHHPIEVAGRFLVWFQAGFAWFGGLIAGIATLAWQGRKAHFKGVAEGVRGLRVGAIRMLDLAAPAAAIGYGVGRIGCLLSGDGDYGVNTTLPWGVHMARNALVPPNPPDALVQPTPIYELLFSLVLFWLLWQLGKRSASGSYRPVGWITGLYLVLSGLGRFLVEFVRINPRLYFHHTMSNAQVAAAASALLGFVILAIAQSRAVQWVPELPSNIGLAPEPSDPLPTAHGL